MRRRSRLPALALFAFALFPLGATGVAAAAGAPSMALVHPLPPVGLAPTEAAQVNVANVSSGGSGPEADELAVWARLVDADGVELARSESRRLPRGATFSWSVPHRELPSASADARGRLQLRAEIFVVGPPAGAFVPSVELVDLATGSSSGAIGDVRTVIAGEAALDGAKKDFY
jgi:hypothetical protein